MSLRFICLQKNALAAADALRFALIGFLVLMKIKRESQIKTVVWSAALVQKIVL
jgi:hypothetical protein